MTDSRNPFTKHEGCQQFQLVSIAGANYALGAWDTVSSSGLNFLEFSHTNQSFNAAVFDCNETTVATVAKELARLEDVLSKCGLPIKLTSNGE